MAMVNNKGSTMGITERVTGSAESVAAEQSVLGGLLLDNSAYWRVVGKITADDFSYIDHKKLWTCIEKLINSGSVADIVTVQENMDGEADFSYVVTIANNTPSAANIVAYAEIVKERAQKRRALTALRGAIAKLSEGAALDEIIYGVMNNLQNLSHEGQSDKSFSQAIDEAFAEAEAAAQRRASGEIRGINTTIPLLNSYTGGFYGPKLIVLGGRPGTYKSAFAWQILMRAAKRGIPAGMISLEMNAAELGNRALANELKVSGHQLSRGDRDAIMYAQDRFNQGMREWPIYIDDCHTLESITSRILEWKHKHDIQIACVDHIQLIKFGKAESRFNELSEVSRQLKLLAMRLNMPVLALSQISRQVEKDNRRPKLSDLRESGNIEQDADIVIFMHREPGRDGPETDAFEILIDKQRSGVSRVAPIELVIHGEHFHIGEKSVQFR